MAEKITKVMMGLTKSDIENINEIQDATDASTKAQAVSIALALTRFIIQKLKKQPETELLLRDEDGKLHRVIMPELDKVREKVK